MQITIHRGAKEIGGNCVEIATDNTRIILDVGIPISELCPRDVTDKRIEPSLPDVPGLFEKGPSIDAILLSHAHADHTGLLDKVNSDIPVLLSRGTSKIMQAGSIFAGQVRLARERTRTIEVGKPFEIGDLRITAFNVDHSSFDCLAFLVEGDGKRVLYSGDLRMHGRKPGMAKRLLTAVSGGSVDALLMEGTNIGDTSKVKVTEEDLETRIRKTIESSAGLVLASFSPQHVDRLVSFYRATRQSGRTFVTDVYGSWVLHLVSGQARIPRPISSNGIRVYYPQHFERTWRRRHLTKLHDKFLEDHIVLDEILDYPDDHVMMFRPSMLRMDFEGIAPPVSHCIYSYWEGYLGREEWVKTRSAFTGLDRGFSIHHTSGHILAKDAVDFIKAVDARCVIPIHSATPERYSELLPNVRLVNDGEIYEVGRRRRSNSVPPEFVEAA